MPHHTDAEFLRWPELGFRDQAAGAVEQVRRPNPAGDDPFLDLRSGNDQNLPADVTGDEPRKDSPPRTHRRRNQFRTRLKKNPAPPAELGIDPCRLTYPPNSSGRGRSRLPNPRNVRLT